MIDGELGQSARSPARAILPHSPGRKPWVKHWNTFIEPQRGGTFPTNAKPQTKCSRRKCRSYGAQSAFVRVYPGFCSCLWHSRHPGLCRSVVPTALTPAPPNKSDNKRKQRNRTTNPTINANNGPPNQSNSKRKQRLRTINSTASANNDTQQTNNKRKQPHQTIIRMINRKLDQFAMSPARAILLQSPGRKPWVSHSYTSIEPQRGGTTSEPRG